MDRGCFDVGDALSEDEASQESPTEKKSEVTNKPSLSSTSDGMALKVTYNCYFRFFNIPLWYHRDNSKVN